jgi:hypothetical protein
MELNLSAYNAISFEITTKLEIPIKTYNSLKKCYAKQKDKEKNNSIIFGSDYVIEKVNYSVMGIINKIKGKNYKLSILYIKYLRKKSKINDLKLQPLSQMLSCLCDIKDSLTFDVEAFFEYNPKKFKNIFSLPFKLEDNGSFDEIRGYRMVKLAKNKKLYTIIMDRPDSNKDFYHTVFFSYTGNINESLPENILKEACNISKKGIVE